MYAIIKVHKTVLESAIEYYAKSFGNDEFQAIIESIAVKEISEGTFRIDSHPQRIMAVLGALADFGEDGLIQVSAPDGQPVKVGLQEAIGNGYEIKLAESEFPDISLPDYVLMHQVFLFMENKFHNAKLTRNS